MAVVVGLRVMEVIDGLKWKEVKAFGMIATHTQFPSLVFPLFDFQNCANIYGATYTVIVIFKTIEILHSLCIEALPLIVRVSTTSLRY